MTDPKLTQEVGDTESVDSFEKRLDETIDANLEYAKEHPTITVPLDIDLLGDDEEV